MKRTLEWLEAAKKGDSDSSACIDAAITRLNSIRAQVVAWRNEAETNAILAHTADPNGPGEGDEMIRANTLDRVLALLDGEATT